MDIQEIVKSIDQIGYWESVYYPYAPMTRAEAVLAGLRVEESDDGSWTIAVWAESYVIRLLCLPD